MKTEILISCDEWENRVAVLEEGSLAEIYFEREEKVIGSIYKGRVENVLPGMGASFVNIGLGRNAFLYVDDILRDPINIGETEITDRRKGHTVNELLKVGSDVLVQIVKEPRGLKGARVSTNISLPGRYLVLMPTGRYSGVSSRIEDAAERARLKQIMRRVRPEGMATIVRTAAQGVSEAELIADLGVQLRLWHGILESYKRASAPALLHKDLNLVFKAVRDFMTSEVTAVSIDSREQYEEIRSTMSLLGPQYIDRLKLVEGPGTLFEQRGIDSELQKLLKPKIPLPSGGHLILEHTEALTVIDVNTGKFTGGRNLEDTIVRTNIEAAAEIARQVRLRDIGGIIVVDFIDMSHERSREQVIQTLTDALRRDRTRSTIQVFSKLGLLEFTRKRVGKDLAGQLRSECPYCGGLGSVMSSETVAIGVLRQIRSRLSRNGGMRKLDVVSDAGVATQLLGWYHDEFVRLARDHEADVALYVDPERPRERVVVEEARRMRVAPSLGSVVEAELLPVRLPNPASGVAQVNGYLIEIRDAANATLQAVKIKIEGVDGNLVRAALAEPLPSAARRRRRDRGRAKEAVSEAPIAPPAPAPELVAASSSRASRQPASVVAAARRSMSDTAFTIQDEDEAPRRPSTQSKPAARTRPPAKPKTAATRQPRRSGGAPRWSEGHTLVVGGEGEIDYDDSEQEGREAPPPATRHTDAVEEQVGASGRRRRRRRGGRGKGRTAEPSFGRAHSENGYEEEDDQEPSRPQPQASREEPPAFDDDLEAVVDPRPARGVPARRFSGPVRQLYGAPVNIDETRSPRDRRSAPPPVATSRRPLTQRPVRREREDELEVVINPKAPRAIRVQVEEHSAVRRTEPVQTASRRTERHESTSRRTARHEGAIHRTEPREGTGQHSPRERSAGPDRRFERKERAPRSAPRREGPAVRQLYPPPDAGNANQSLAETSQTPERGEGKAKPGFGRQPRGPLMRTAGAKPVPKGKVRQLYPPPEPSEQGEGDGADIRSLENVAYDNESVTDGVAFDEAGDADQTSVFITDEQELEERRRRARERAEAKRRLQDEGDASEGAGSSPQSPEAPPNENDEWPVF